MGNQKQKWTPEEEQALLAGVDKHGPGKWKNILKDPEFAPFLTNRSNIDLKDKWRNLSVSHSAPGTREKRTSKPKPTLPALAYPQNTSPAPLATVLPADNAPSDGFVDDIPNSTLDGNNTAKYNALIFEALSTTKDNSGLDISAIVKYIEQRHDVPPNFRKQITGRLRRLLLQGKLEKVQNCYRLLTSTPLGTKAPISKPKDVKLRQSQNTGTVVSSETAEEAALTAAYKVAEAENKSFLAAEAVKEAERVSKMQEDTDSMLQLIKEIYEQCSHGEILLLA